MEHSTPSRTSPNPFLANSPSDVVTGNFVLPTLSSSPLIPEGAKTVPTTPQGKSQSPIVVGKRFLRREYAFILSPDVSPNNDSRKVDLRTWLAGGMITGTPNFTDDIDHRASRRFRECETHVVGDKPLLETQTRR